MADSIPEVKKLNYALENYFRNTIIPQLFVDANLILQKFTPPAMKQFSLALTDVGRPIEEIKDNFRFPSIIENIHQVINSNEILEKEIQTSDMRWYQMNIIPYVIMEDNRTDGVIITFVEITSRIKDLKDLETLISDYETLLDTISHDIKTPLTSLVLAIDLFKNVTPDDEKEFRLLFQIVENAIRKMQSLIHELTESRQQQHKYKAETELLNFEHILEDVRLTINDLILSNHVSIKSEIGMSEIIFSRRKLRSILLNLLTNAIKFRSPDHPVEILITTEQKDGYFLIRVKDNGRGIDPAKQDVIFSKYYRAENSIEGTGIGLYLVKEIVTSSGGKIGLTSELGKGSEFTIWLKQT